MKVYCTRPGYPGQNEPHSTEIADGDLLGMKKHQRDEVQCVTCGMPLILNGRYVPIKKLGQGGFGYTFLALDLKFGLDSKRAIKQFRSDLLLSAGQIALAKKAFDREYKIQDQLRHPQIPRVYEPFDIEIPSYGNTNQSIYYYFVQEYIEGEDLQKKLKNRQQQSNSTFSELEVQDILKQVLKALSYIHGLSIPIIHRDIKPSNIIQAGDGTCYLVDFGAVKQVLPVSDSSKQTTIMGTPGYAPSEQFDGIVDFSSDLYALAKTCICLLTGSPSSPPPWGTSDLLTKVLTKMISLDPQMRYRSTVEVQDALVINDQLAGKSKDKKTPHIDITWILLILTGILLTIVGIAHFQQKKIVPFSPDSKARLSDVQPPSEEATYGGSTTWEPLSKVINSAIERQHEPFKLKLIPKDKHVPSEEGIEMLIRGELDFSLSSKSIIPKTIQDGKINLLQTIVARTRKVMVVHPDLKIKYITSSEADRIYKGDIKKWSELPGRNLPDLVIEYYQTNKKYLSSQRQSKNLYTIIKDKDTLFKEMSKERGSVTITPVNLAAAGCSVKSVPIIQDGKDKVSVYSQEDCIKGLRKINTNYIKQDDDWNQDLSIFFREDDKQNIGKAYATMLCTKEGKAIIEKAGYLPSSKSCI
jgi:serine/threonine protein kinase